MGPVHGPMAFFCEQKSKFTLCCEGSFEAGAFLFLVGKCLGAWPGNSFRRTEIPTRQAAVFASQVIDLRLAGDMAGRVQPSPADEVARNRGALENKLRPEVFLSAPFALSTSRSPQAASGNSA